MFLWNTNIEIYNLGSELMINLKDSKTKENLLKAFAGESQARNRYTFAAETAKNEGLFIIEDLFIYTANQEKAHAQEFMKRLKEFSGGDINISTAYPVEVEDKTLTLLKSAEKHEMAEFDQIYKDFANIAKEEGFEAISTLFDNIASIENVHGNRFGAFAKDLEANTLFKKADAIPWMCTNCGYIYEGTEAPKACPVCQHPQGYFIEFPKSPFE